MSGIQQLTPVSIFLGPFCHVTGFHDNQHKFTINQMVYHKDFLHIVNFLKLICKSNSETIKRNLFNKYNVEELLSHVIQEAH